VDGGSCTAQAWHSMAWHCTCGAGVGALYRTTGVRAQLGELLFPVARPRGVAGCWLGWADAQPLHPDHRSLHRQSRRLAAEQAVEAEHGTSTSCGGKGGAGACGSRSLGRIRRRPRRPAKHIRDRGGGRCWRWRWRYQCRRRWGWAVWSCPRTFSLTSSCSWRVGCEWSGAL
jgi:hypothetical protein